MGSYMNMATGLSRIEILQAIDVVIAADVPLLLWGPPGVGKSRMMEQVARLQGRSIYIVLGSIRDATDFSGLPVLRDGEVWLAPPSWAVSAVADGWSMVLLDELTTVVPSTQAAMLGLVLDRRLGDLVIPATVAIVAAANPQDLAVNGQDLDPPTANRFCHLWFEANVSDWVRGMRSGWSDPTPFEHRSAESDRARWLTIVTEFLERRPDLFYQMPDHALGRSGPWPSPRSWADGVIRVAAAADACNVSDDVRFAVIAGCVGEAAALELLVFATDLDLPDPAAVLADPSLIEHDPARLDRTLAVASSVVTLVLDTLNEQRWLATWDVLAHLAELGLPDLAVAVAAPLAEARQPAWRAPTQARCLTPVLVAAGLT